jgi:hypothetical protein
MPASEVNDSCSHQDTGFEQAVDAQSTTSVASQPSSSADQISESEVREVNVEHNIVRHSRNERVQTCMAPSSGRNDLISGTPFDLEAIDLGPLFDDTNCGIVFEYFMSDKTFTPTWSCAL